MTSRDSFTTLTNDVLLSETRRLAACERTATAELIAALAEVDARRLYLGQGCSSLFTYCTRVLRLSEHAAYGRIEAARAARKFPAVLDLLADGSINLTTVCLVASHLTPENHREVLAAATHKSKREVEELVARLRPRPDAAALVRKLPTPKTSPASAAPTAATSAVAGPPPTKSDGSSEPAIPMSRATIAPLAPEWARDGGQCAFLGAMGRCGETGFLEFHHVVPFAERGETSPATVQLRCRAHNAYEAEQWFGPMFMREHRSVWTEMDAVTAPLETGYYVEGFTDATRRVEASRETSGLSTSP